VRAAVEGLQPARSLAAGLPPAFFGNDFTRELIGAFDEVLAPVFATLDDFDAYLDPRYAPDDFLCWLAGWLGFPVDERWPVDRIRSHLADARQGLLCRGTLTGVEAAIRAYTGRTPRLEDSGGVAWSARPLGPFPGDPRPRLVVHIEDPDGTIDREVVERLVAETKPANVRHEIVITASTWVVP
jgi:phage tail-like protein